MTLVGQLQSFIAYYYSPWSTQMAYLSQTLCNTRQLKIEKKPIYCMWTKEKDRKGTSLLVLLVCSEPLGTFKTYRTRFTTDLIEEADESQRRNKGSQALTLAGGVQPHRQHPGI